MDDKKDDLTAVAVTASAIEKNLPQDNDHELEVTHEGDFGTKRDLPPRVVSMIAIAGTIGTGLFLGSGAALTLGGPVGAWLGYFFMGLLVCGMMYSLGEMTCFAPNIGGFIEMGSKYVDESFGFMMGIDYILQCGLAIPGEISAIAVMISYWDSTITHAGAYIAVFLILTILINMFAVKFYGEIEFFFACLKLVTLIGLIIFGIVANVGGTPNHEFIGGKYWQTEPFNDNFMNVQPVNLSRFLGFWAVLTKAAFSYGGIEGIGVLAGEAHNPRKTMKMAVRTVFYRVIGIYMLAILIIGLDVSQHSPELLDDVAAGGATAASSPFVVICKQTGVAVLPSIINAVVMTSALSSANENVYATSRTLMAMAKQNALPKIFLRTSKSGVPYAGVFVSFLFACLAFLTLGSGGAEQAFDWLSNLSALSSIIIWFSISVCYIRFHKALKVQGIDRKTLPLRSWFQPYLAWVCTVAFAIVLVFSGFRSFIGGFKVIGFISNYITIPVVILCFIGYKLVRKTKFVSADEVDLSNGPAECLDGTRYDNIYAGNQGGMFSQGQGLGQGQKY